mgnify:CR=1 FL=1
MPVVIVDNTAYVSGQLPWSHDFGSIIQGKVDRDLSIEKARTAAQRCVLAALSALELELGDLNAINRAVKVTGFVASSVNFNLQPSVIDGASQLLVKLFGEKGKHARSAIGVSELPRNATVEIDFIFSLKD